MVKDKVILSGLVGLALSLALLVGHFLSTVVDNVWLRGWISLGVAIIVTIVLSYYYGKYRVRKKENK